MISLNLHETKSVVVKKDSVGDNHWISLLIDQAGGNHIEVVMFHDGSLVLQEDSEDPLE